MYKCRTTALSVVFLGIGLFHCRADDRPLVLAKHLAQTRFHGWTYGSDRREHQIDCVQFVLAVVEETAHVTLTNPIRTRILISDMSDAALKNHGYAVILDEDPRTKGVQEALVQARLGIRIAPKDAQPGDLIQYWMKQSDGIWFGHAGIVESIDNANGIPRAVIFGAHKSQNAIARSSFTLNLTGNDPGRRIYAVRLH
jgi:hypothetical protein